ncbi:MAG: peptidoglycan recognition family protein [Chloroflexota bacterium]
MSKKYSRREILMGVGLVGAGTIACACSASALLGLWWLNQSPDTSPTQSLVTALATDSRPIIPQPPIISRASWGALPPNHDARNENGFYSADNPVGWRVYDVDRHNMYQTIIIHHAAFYEANDLDTLQEIQRVHRGNRGWADLAYHFLIGQNGLIYEGRDWQVRGTHVGSYNTGSLGICLLGNFMTQSPTVAQLNSTLSLIRWATDYFAPTHIASHREFNRQTLCPGDNLYAYMEQFVTASGLRLGNDGYIPPDEASACICCTCDTHI